MCHIKPLVSPPKTLAAHSGPKQSPSRDPRHANVTILVSRTQRLIYCPSPTAAGCSNPQTHWERPKEREPVPNYLERIFDSEGGGAGETPNTHWALLKKSKASGHLFGTYFRFLGGGLRLWLNKNNNKTRKRAMAHYLEFLFGPQARPFIRPLVITGPQVHEFGDGG